MLFANDLDMVTYEKRRTTTQNTEDHQQARLVSLACSLLNNDSIKQLIVSWYAKVTCQTKLFQPVSVLSLKFLRCGGNKYRNVKKSLRLFGQKGPIISSLQIPLRNIKIQNIYYILRPWCTGQTKGLLYKQLQPTTLDLPTCVPYGLHLDFVPFMELEPCWRQ